jgi:hypothetical protein
MIGKHYISQDGKVCVLVPEPVENSCDGCMFQTKQGCNMRDPVENKFKAGEYICHLSDVVFVEVTDDG